MKLKINLKKGEKSTKKTNTLSTIPTVHSTLILDGKGRVSKMGREMANITLHRLQVMHNKH